MSQGNMRCPYCEDEEIQKRVIANNGLAFAFPTNIPIVPGHILVSPVRCVRYYEDLSLEEKIAFEDMRLKMKLALKRAYGAQGFNYAWNEEKVGGQSVPHLHLHILPRKEGDTGVHQYEPRQFLYRPRARTEPTPLEELRHTAMVVRRALEELARERGLIIEQRKTRGTI